MGSQHFSRTARRVNSVMGRLALLAADLIRACSSGSNPRIMGLRPLRIMRAPPDSSFFFLVFIPLSYTHFGYRQINLDRAIDYSHFARLLLFRLRKRHTNTEEWTMFASHFRAGTGAVLVETREESRLLSTLLAELPEAQCLTVAAPGGALKDAKTGKVESGDKGLAAGLTWLASGPGRVLFVYDWHMLVNSPGHWRTLLESLPGIRAPRNASETDTASLVIFVAPSWELQPANPLRGLLPILQFAPPGRESLATIAGGLHKLNGEREAVVDALCGLSADAAEQSCAEVLVRTGGKWDVDALRESGRQQLLSAGLELWPQVKEMGGLSGLTDFAKAEVFPWVRDGQLAIRRLLCAGVPGVGKSYCARWIAHELKCDCVRLSIPRLKAGIVGASEGNLRRSLRTIDAKAEHSPLVVVLDEIDTIARDGLDGGTSSGMFAELLTWLRESTSQAVVIATLNRLDKLDAALESRFQARFFFDLPSQRERQSIAAIHYSRLACDGVETSSTITAAATDGFSSREIAEHVIPSVARLSKRKPDGHTIGKVCQAYTPAARTQAEQLASMRRAASSLRRANDPDTTTAPTGRRVSK